MNTDSLKTAVGMLKADKYIYRLSKPCLSVTTEIRCLAPTKIKAVATVDDTVDFENP